MSIDLLLGESKCHDETPLSQRNVSPANNTIFGDGHPFRILPNSVGQSPSISMQGLRQDILR